MLRIKHLPLSLVACVALFATGCKSPTLTVMTFNIRYDTPSDGPNAWPKRRAFVADIIRKHDPDLLGLQEVLMNQRDQLLADLPAYGCIGVGRDDGKDKGEFSPIMYKKSRFTPVMKDWFWLSESPSEPGRKGWDAACPRIATWALLGDALSKRYVFILNTHLDHQGELARRMAASQIQRSLADSPWNRPLLVMGDFNCGPNQPPHTILIEGSKEVDRRHTAPTLYDAFTRVVGNETDAGTFNGFEGVRTGARIDWILHTDHLTPLTCEIERDSRNGRYPSDHFPVVARFRIVCSP